MGKIYQKIIRRIMILGIVTISLCNLQVQNAVAAQKKPQMKVHFIDVGAGDAILIQYGERKAAEYALIDAGPVYYQKINKRKIDTSNRVHEYLKKHGIYHLKFVLLTHPHQDHIGGMIKILNDSAIQIDTIYGNDLHLQLLQSSDDPKEQTAQTAVMKEYRDNEGIYEAVIQKMTQRINQGKLKYIVPKPGQKVWIGKASLTFYGVIQNNYTYARRGDLNYRQVNKYSIVSKLTYGKNTFLMTGDAQKDTIELLSKRGYNLQAQVLKVPHHGMQDILEDKNETRSDHKTLIDQVKAKISIISNGYDNIYRAPHKKVLQDLSASDIYDTGSRGTILVTSDGIKLSIKTQKKKGPRQKAVRTGPKNVKIKSSVKGIKTLELKEKDKEVVKSKKSIHFQFTASYGVSGERIVRFKIVPANKNPKNYPWISGNRIVYQKKNQKVRLYVRFLNHAGYQTARKSSIFMIEDKKDKKKKDKKERKANDQTNRNRH